MYMLHQFTLWNDGSTNCWLSYHGKASMATHDLRRRTRRRCRRAGGRLGVQALWGQQRAAQSVKCMQTYLFHIYCTFRATLFLCIFVFCGVQLWLQLYTETSAVLTRVGSILKPMQEQQHPRSTGLQGENQSEASPSPFA